MKINGQAVTTKTHEDVLVLPRGDEMIVLRARAIADYEEFDEVCPVPKPPGRLTKDGFIPNLKDATYKAQAEKHSLQRVGWMVVTSLQDVEWDKVDPANPKTWVDWEDDMKKAGFSSVERNLILGLVLDVNALDERKLKVARESFIRGQEEVQNESDSQTSEPKSTPSGQPASEQE